MLKIIKYICILGCILFFINCSGLNTNTNKTLRSKPSIYFSVSLATEKTYPDFYSGVSFDYREIFDGYYLAGERIEKKIDAVLENSNLFSNTQAITEKSDYQIIFIFEWEPHTFSDELIRAGKEGYIEGSFGLFPMYFSETLLMNAELFKNNNKLGSYKYKEDLRVWCWVGALVNLARDDEYKLEKIDTLVEKMTKAFIKDTFEIVLPTTTLGSGLAEDSVQKIAVNVNPEEPWTGKWKVEGSLAVGGIWVMKQSGRTVKSTKDSYYKIEGEIVGNQLEGKVLGEANIYWNFVINISSDGQTFIGETTGGLVRLSGPIKGKRE